MLAPFDADRRRTAVGHRGARPQVRDVPEWLVPQYSAELPSALTASLNQLTVEKLPSSEPHDLAVRDAKTGFTFFNIQGHQYDYDPGAQSLTVNGGKLTMSQDFANALGRPSDVGAVVGEISVGAVMQPA